jgi:hypothetical protein
MRSAFFEQRVPIVFTMASEATLSRSNSESSTTRAAQAKRPLSQSPARSPAPSRSPDPFAVEDRSKDNVVGAWKGHGGGAAKEAAGPGPVPVPDWEAMKERITRDLTAKFELKSQKYFEVIEQKDAIIREKDERLARSSRELLKAQARITELEGQVEVHKRVAERCDEQLRAKARELERLQSDMLSTGAKDRDR